MGDENLELVDAAKMAAAETSPPATRGDKAKKQKAAPPPDPACKPCGLYLKGCKTPLMFGTLPAKEPKPGRRYMGVGEAPGYHEDEKSHQVFTGPSGTKKDQLFREAGIDPETVYFSNAVKCRPPDNNLADKKPIKHCRSFLLSEIDAYKPDIIIALGGVAAHGLTGRPRSVSDVRGGIERINVNGRTYPVVVTYHPAFVLRSPANEEKVIVDLTIARRFLEIRPPGVEYVTVDEPGILDLVFEVASSSPRVAVDVETTTVAPYSPGARVLSCSCTFEYEGANTTFIFPLRHRENKLSRRVQSMIEDGLRGVLETSEEVIFHNSIFDVAFLEGMFPGLRLPADKIRDTMVEHYLAVTEEKGTHGLKMLGNQYTQHIDYDHEVEEFFASRRVAKNNRQYEDLPFEDVLLPYNAFDTEVTADVGRVLWPMVEAEGQDGVYEDLMRPALRMLLDVQRNGVCLDFGALKEIEAVLRAERWKASSDLARDEHAVEACKRWTKVKEDKANARRKSKITLDTLEFNVNSTDCMKILLYQVLGLTPIEYTETGAPSTNKEVLKAYEEATGLSVFEKILEVRRVDKLLGMYSEEKISGWLGDDGLAHPELKPCGTVTGRLSSARPNFQNFPKKGDMKVVRSIVKSRFPGGKIVRADYSQIELRILAMKSGDENMLQAFRDKEDIHTAILLQMFEMGREEYLARPEDERDRLRRVAKTIDFGIIYGQQAVALAKKLTSELGRQVTPEEAQEKMDVFLRKHGGVSSWIEETKRKAAETLSITTSFGRRRRLVALAYPENRETYSEAERQAVNAGIQADASDLTLFSAIKVNDEFRSRGMKAKLIGLIHDEMLADAPESEAMDVAKIIREKMLDVPKFITVPVEVEVEIGPNWRDTEVVDV